MKELTVKHMKKVFKKTLKNSNNKFIPHSASLLKWCEASGITQNFEWVRRLILDELSQNEELGNYVFFDAGMYDIHLDNDGIFMLADILNGFFGEEQVRLTWKYFRTVNEEAKLYYDIRQTLRAANNEQLKVYSDTWKKTEAANDKENSVIQSLLNMIKQEENRRAKVNRSLISRYRRFVLKTAD